MLVDPVDEQEALDRIRGWIHLRSGAVRYVVTPNVQHAVMFQRDPEFRTAYARASMALVDGAPLVWASRLLGLPLPARVAGSDLVPALFEAGGPAGSPLSVFLLGAAPGVGERAARMAESRFPRLKVAGTYSPPLGFERKPEENDRIISLVNEARPDVLIIGLGAPKQELWVHRHRARLEVPVAICAGATIDFMAGHRKRAPKWMREVGVEWVHRVITEPRRLAPRYASDAIRFPSLVWKEWRTKPERDA
jgi:N-acetylglucosaminyldiphosphoundecaprenol N-acetyl-beta-D-mannosaminyltransferase